MNKGLRKVMLALVLCAPVVCLGAEGEGGAGRVESSRTWSREDFREIQSPVSILEKVNGQFFNWKPEYGGEPDLDCFPTEDLATSVPELIDWEVPGQVMRGVRKDRLMAVLVEAAGQIEGQVEDCYLLLLAVAEAFRDVERTVNGQANQLSTHTTALAEMHAQLRAHQERIARLEGKNLELEQQVAQLARAVQQLQQSARTRTQAAGN